jgi:hypothetical protein
MHIHESINYEVEFCMNNPCIPTEKEITSMLDERNDAVHHVPIEEVDNVQIDDVVVDRVGFKDATIYK